MPHGKEREFIRETSALAEQVAWLQRYNFLTSFGELGIETFHRDERARRVWAMRADVPDHYTGGMRTFVDCLTRRHQEITSEDVIAYFIDCRARLEELRASTQNALARQPLTTEAEAAHQQELVGLDEQLTYLRDQAALVVKLLEPGLTFKEIRHRVAGV